MAVKVNIGKLELNGNLKDIKNYIDEKGIHLIEFDAEDLDMLQRLPFHHQDPFDRLIIAQTKAKSLEIISNDWQVNKYFEQ
jgi:PIN domain nuclease of toxin-antitoxin system